jgi:hypothetical protein
MRKDSVHQNAADDVDEQVQDDAVIGRALKWSLLAFAIVGSAIGGGLYYARSSAPRAEVKERTLAPVAIRSVEYADLPAVRFADVTAESGITFKHENAARGEKLLPETMGGGCAFFDFDNDGDQDLLFVNGLDRWSWDESSDQKPATMALYKNDGKGQFEDVTKGSGLEVAIYGMGAASGDYDGDGLIDLFVTAVGENRLFHNAGDGRFVDVTENAGVAGVDSQWSTSAGWFDYDRDSDLDLFVCNYVKWSRDDDAGQNFQLTGGGRAYGRPQNFEGSFPYLYRNDGQGRFTDVSEQAGIQVRNRATKVPVAKSLGVVFEDVDQDGWLDVIVANDTVQNFLFHNRGDGTFREIGEATGIAFDMNGNARGAMGIDAARFRNDDSLGIAIANFSNEMTALYVTGGDLMQFMDEAIATGIGPSSRLELKFGLFFWDYDLDGRLDMLTANGHLEEDINRVQPSQHYAQSAHLFWNCGAEGNTEFLPVKAEDCGEDLLKPIVGRGAAYADIDADGDLDAVITGIAATPRLLRNDLKTGDHWLRFKLSGVSCNRDAIGAEVEVQVAGRTLRRRVSPTRSYLSQVELPVTFGLGAADRIDRATVYWPDGTEQQLSVDAVDRAYNVVQDVSPPSKESPASTVAPASTTPTLIGRAGRMERVTASVSDALGADPLAAQ